MRRLDGLGIPYEVIPGVSSFTAAAAAVIAAEGEKKKDKLHPLAQAMLKGALLALLPLMAFSRAVRNSTWFISVCIVALLSSE